jgi:DNA-binding transcriptional LysR family regulator
MAAHPAGSQTRIWLDQILKQHHLSLNIIAEFDSPEAIKQAVIAGMGVAVLPDYVIQQEQQSGIIHALPVEDADLQRTLNLIPVLILLYRTFVL